MKRKFRILPFIGIDSDGRDVFIAQIQVRDILFWHIVTEISDDSEDYVMDRAKEIVDILENPNR